MMNEYEFELQEIFRELEEDMPDYRPWYAQ